MPNRKQVLSFQHPLKRAILLLNSLYFLALRQRKEGLNCTLTRSAKCLAVWSELLRMRFLFFLG